jgi:hypothetical protein
VTIAIVVELSKYFRMNRKYWYGMCCKYKIMLIATVTGIFKVLAMWQCGMKLNQNSKTNC